MLTVTSPTALQHVAALHAHHSGYHTNSGKKCVRIPWGRHLISGRNGTEHLCWPATSLATGDAVQGLLGLMVLHVMPDTQLDPVNPPVFASQISVYAPPPSDQTIRHTQLKSLPGKCVALTSNTEQGKTAQRNPSCSFQHPETFT